MRKLLFEVQEIDQYLLQAMPPDSRLLFEAKMLTNAALEEKVHCQQAAHQLVRQMGRAAQREKLAAVHRYLWETDDAFHTEISAIFKS